VGYFGVDYSTPSGNTAVVICGYPFEKNYQMWGMGGPIQNITTYEYYYEIDTTGGQSGSPIIRPDYVGNGVYGSVLGIHTGYGGDFAKNRGVRITQSVAGFFSAYKA